MGDDPLARPLAVRVLSPFGSKRQRLAAGSMSQSVGRRRVRSTRATLTTPLECTAERSGAGCQRRRVGVIGTEANPRTRDALTTLAWTTSPASADAAKWSEAPACTRMCMQPQFYLPESWVRNSDEMPYMRPVTRFPYAAHSNRGTGEKRVESVLTDCHVPVSCSPCSDLCRYSPDPRPGGARPGARDGWP